MKTKGKKGEGKGKPKGKWKSKGKSIGKGKIKGKEKGKARLGDQVNNPDMLNVVVRGVVCMIV